MWGDLVKELKKKSDILPAGWTEATDAAGIVLYKNVSVGVASYERPDETYDVTQHLDEIISSLVPSGWTQYHDASGKAYYAHTNGTTMYERPIAVHTTRTDGNASAKLARAVSKSRIQEIQSQGVYMTAVNDNRYCQATTGDQ